MKNNSFDIAIAGGGFAGSSLAGVLARGGLNVVVFERERHFRDRIRGEFTWPWGCAELDRLGLLSVFENNGALPLERIDDYVDGTYNRTIDMMPRAGLSYQHAPIQDALLDWAAAQGAEIIRPARVLAFQPGDLPALRYEHDGAESTVSARLVIAATGRESGARHWTGGASESDPEHHRFGGVSIEGANFRDGSLVLAQHAPEQAMVFHLGNGLARLYLRTFGDDLQQTEADRFFDRLLDYVRPWFSKETLSDARQVGPLGFFPNSNTWATKAVAPGIALIGDVAGTGDPSGGHGTSLVFRDVRVLSDLLLDSDDWANALAVYDTERKRYFDILHARDRWYGHVAAERGPDGERRRAQQIKARELDPTLGGFATIEFFGPDGLIADEEHRRIYFGDNLAEQSNDPISN